MPTMTHAERYRERAEALERRADALRNSGTSRQRMTHRRRRIYASQLDDARRLNQTAEALHAMAWAIENRRLPGAIDLPRPLSTEAVQRLLWFRTNRDRRPDNHDAELVKIHADEIMDAADRLAETIDDYREHGSSGTPADATRPDPYALKLRLAELAAQNIEGFWPTPPTIAQIVMHAADIGPDVQRVLEPSCGAGCLLIEAVNFARAAGAKKARFLGYELRADLADVATDRTATMDDAHLIEVRAFNFLEAPWFENWADVVVMNPPFEHGQEADHIMQAWKWLRPGGRLVAIVSAGLMFRDRAKEMRFREWMTREAVGTGYIHSLPDDAFDRPDAPRRTQIRTKLLVLDKPTA